MITYNQTFADANLILETFKNLEMSYIILVSTNGSIVYGMQYNVTSQSLEPLTSSIMAHLASDSYILGRSIEGIYTSGLLSVDGRPVLFAARPILTSDGQGPSHGAFFMGRVMDQVVLDRFEASTALPIKLFMINDTSLTSEITSAGLSDLIDNRMTIKVLNESTIAGYALADDIYGYPVAAIRVTIERDIHAQGVMSNYSLLASLTIASLIFGLIVFFAIDRTVTSRLSNLRQDVSRVGSKSEGKMHVASQGQDEIGVLADNINGMLVAINTAQERLIDSERRYRGIVEDQNELIARFDPELRVTFMNVPFLRTVDTDWDMVKGKRLDNLMGRKTVDMIMGHVGELSIATPVSTFESAVEGHEGTIWVRTSLRAIYDGAGKITEYQTVSTEITERKKMEEALKQANNKLGILSNITRHDMNNQMLVLNGFLELCKLQNRDPDVAMYLDKINRAAANIQVQIAFTREYQELGIQAPIWTSVGGQIAKAFALLHPAGISLEDRTNGLEILTDPLAEKALYNLVDNSIRHGERITRIRIDLQPVGDAMLVIYEDDGVGISAKDRLHLFEKGSGKQTGFGLFLIREIFGITGITIYENGHIGEGVRFEILVPSGAWRRLSS